MVAMATVASATTLHNAAVARGARVRRITAASSSSSSASPVRENPGTCSTRRALVLIALSSGIAESLQRSTFTIAAEAGFQAYYGIAASPSSYGGYGGNSKQQEDAEYTYEVPQEWKQRLVSKIEKGTNGTDSEFYNPQKKTEKTYLTYLPGYRQLPALESVLDNLALSDVELQDEIQEAENIKSSNRTDGSGQLYYDFEIEGPSVRRLISVTCLRNKLYAHFVKTPAQDWKTHEPMLRHIHESFATVKK